MYIFIYIYIFSFFFGGGDSTCACDMSTWTSGRDHQVPRHFNRNLNDIAQLGTELSIINLEFALFSR